MFQHSTNLKFTGGAFINNNDGTVVNEQNGITGALYESVVNRYYRPTDRLNIITSMPVISPSALAQKPLAALDQLYSQILSTSTDTKLRTVDILFFFNVNPKIRVITASNLEDCSENLLGLQPGDGFEALRKIHSLVHIPERSLMLDDADTNLPHPGLMPDDAYDNLLLLEDHYREEEEIKFYHKSFIDYMLDHSRSLEYCVDLEEMCMRLGVACIVTIRTFTLQPTPSRIAYRTFPLSFTYYILIPHA